MNPDRLCKLQGDFHAYLLGEASAIQTSIVDDNRVGAEKRLKIYHDAYRLRLIEALSEAYPNLGKLLGDDLFDSVARSYIAAYPSTFRNLRWFGGELAEHLAIELAQHPIASELARFEWTLALAFDSADAPILSNADLANVPAESWGALRFALHPSVRILDMGLNTPAVWKALDADQAPPDVEQIPAAWLIWRKELNPHFRSLDAGERLCLALLGEDASFAELCEALQQDAGQDDAVQQTARALSTWLADGLLSQAMLGASHALTMHW